MDGLIPVNVVRVIAGDPDTYFSLYREQIALVVGQCHFFILTTDHRLWHEITRLVTRATKVHAMSWWLFQYLAHEKHENSEPFELLYDMVIKEMKEELWK